MRLGARSRLCLVLLGLIAVAAIVADACLLRALERDLTRHIREDLRARLALVESQASRFDASLDDLDRWDAFADEAGARARARVTVIRLDGRAIGDSDVPRRDLESVDDHAAHPEVAQAIAEGRGESTRPSSTARVRTMYAAAPFGRGADLTPAGIVRVGLPLAEVDVAVARARRLLLAGSLIALGVAALVSTSAVHWLLAAVRRMTDAARRMAAGDLDARTRLAGSDELGELGRTLDHLAETLGRALAELRADRDLTSGILDAMREGVLVIGADGRVALVNPALRELMLLGADVVGRTPLEAFRHAELEELLDRARATGEPQVGEIEVAGVRPRRLLVRVSHLRGDAGFVVVLFDVTDLRRLESLRRDFVANVSHELRTPVTAIRSAAETLRGAAERDPSAIPRFLGMIERNAERLQALVEDLLDLSRIESRQYQLRLEPLELAAAITRAAALMRDRAERKRITLRVAVEADVPQAVGDARAVEQILANLVDNAVKYCPEGCEVVVGAHKSGEQVVVTVRDDGPGIEARHLPRLFERFYRVDAGRSREQGGTGLGLAIVKHLVEAMGGRVGVASAPGEGATFWFTLPSATAGQG